MRGGRQRSGSMATRSFRCRATCVSYGGQADQTRRSQDASDAVGHCLRDEFGKVDPEISLGVGHDQCPTTGGHRREHGTYLAVQLGEGCLLHDRSRSPQRRLVNVRGGGTSRACGRDDLVSAHRADVFVRVFLAQD